MNDKQDKLDIEEIAELTETGVDVSRHFSGQHDTKQRINIEFPLTLLKDIDVECKRVGMTRQAWIKMICDERLQDISAVDLSEKFVQDDVNWGLHGND